MKEEYIKPEIQAIEVYCSEVIATSPDLVPSEESGADPGNGML